MHAILRLVRAGEGDDPCLSADERATCTELGTPQLRMAARVAAKRAAAGLMGPGTASHHLTINRSPAGAPRLGSGGPHGQPLPSVTMSHGGGWGAALAWLPDGKKHHDHHH